MTNILIINCQCEHSTDCERNRGAAAVMSSTIQILRKFIHDAEIVTMVQHSKNFSAQHNIKVIENDVFSLKYFSLFNSLNSSFNLLRCIIWAFFNKFLNLNIKMLTNQRKLKEYVKADIIIDLSMDLYSDDIGTRSIIEHSKELLCSVLLRKPVVIFAQSMGPFTNKLTRWLARFTLNKVDLITVREEISKSHLEKVGVDKIQIYVTADPAFLLEPASKESVKEIFLKENIDKDNRPLIGITRQLLNPMASATKKSPYLKYIELIYNMLLYCLPENVFKILIKKMTHTEYYSNLKLAHYNNVKKFLGPVVDYLTDELNATVIILPHVYSTAEETDKIIGKEIYRAVKSKHEVKVIINQYRAEELKGIIGECDLFIGAKMHANIASTSMHVPTIALSYSYKFYGIMKMLGQEKYICDIKTLDAETLLSKINDIWPYREEIRKELMSRVKSVQERALFNGKLVKELLESKG